MGNSRTSLALLCSLSAAWPIAGCDRPPEGRLECDNLDESNCLLPFPSDLYRVTTPSPRLDIPEAAMPKNTDGKHIDPSAYRVNGWSHVTPIYFAFEDVTLAGTVGKDEIARSLTPGSPTLVIDAESGELHPHWVEFDYQSEDAQAPVLAIRIARPLAYGRRYVVAVRGLTDSTGAPIRAGRGFRALRDNTTPEVVAIADRRAHFEEQVFPVLARAGVDRGALQLAWDFTTTSEDAGTRQLLAARSKLMSLIGTQGPEYSITTVEDFADGPIAKKLTGVARVPSFLQAKDAKLIKRLRLGADGLPEPQGTMDVEFTLQIPRGALASVTPMAVMQYGHGFLGRKAEADNAWLREWADRDGFLILATDMEGMNEEAAITWFSVLPDDASLAPELSGWPMQGILNHVALQRMMKGRFFADTDARYTRAGGGAFYDPARLYYHGNSQGGTIGNIVIAMSEDITRAILGVPGCSFVFLVSRASQWVGIGPIIEGRYPDSRDMQVILGLVQLGFDRFEPASFVRRVTDDPFPGLPSHRVLLQVAKEDAQVNNDISAYLGRVVGAKLLQPALRPVYGLAPATPPLTTGNGYVEFDFGVADNPKPNRPASSTTDTHGLVRKNLKAQAQGWRFLETGVIDHFCDGPCNPE